MYSSISKKDYSERNKDKLKNSFGDRSVKLNSSCKIILLIGFCCPTIKNDICALALVGICDKY